MRQKFLFFSLLLLMILPLISSSPETCNSGYGLKLCAYPSHEGSIREYVYGDYIDLLCEPAGSTLFLDSNTNACTYSGCSGFPVANQYRYYYGSGIENLNPVCFMEGNRIGLSLSDFKEVLCHEDDDKCVGSTSYKCKREFVWTSDTSGSFQNYWEDLGFIEGKCGYSEKRDLPDEPISSTNFLVRFFQTIINWFKGLFK